MARRHVALCAAFLASLQLTTVAAPAFAQAPAAQPSGPDAIHLKDNNVIRGTLSELVVGDHVTVLLTNGQTARIMWSFIARIERNGVEQPMGGAPAPALAPEAAGGTVTVHIEGSSEATLEQQSGAGWLAVCSATCDRALPLDATYRMVGGGMRNSGAFRLAGAPGDRVVLVVDPASRGAFVGGIVLISVGSPVMLIGGMVLMVVAIANAVGDKNTGTTEAVGWTMLGGGLAGLITGIVLLAGNSRTKVEQSLAARSAAWMARGQASNDAWKRLPTFVDVPKPMPNAPMAVPLFTHTF